MAITLADIYREPEVKLPASIGVGAIVAIGTERYMLSRAGQKLVVASNLASGCNRTYDPVAVDRVDGFTKAEIQAAMDCEPLENVYYIGHAADVLRVVKPEQET